MILNKIRKKHPLIHNITNYVVASFQANGLLAIGASPLMADDALEVAEIVPQVDALLINIGTINPRTKEAIIVAGKEANKQAIPVVLDPVGVGISQFRKEVVQELLENVQFSLIRCNAGELASIANVKWEQNGVDSGQGDMNIADEAKRVAAQYNCYVIVSGEEDVLTDGNRVSFISGGHVQMTEVTGTGCLLGSICAAALTLNPEDSYQHLYDTLATYKLVASNAFETSPLLGDFQCSILNELHQLSKEELK